jgi:hypothetical protein
VLRACVLAACRTAVRYLPDGSIAGATLRYVPEYTKSLSASIAKLVGAIRAHPPRGGRVDPRRYVWFERTLAFMNRRGERPVIVLNPIHPRVLAELRRWRYPARRTALAYLRRLHRRFHFVVVDAQDSRRWHGSPTDWSNATHINRRNMRRLLRYVVAHSHGALR